MALIDEEQWSSFRKVSTYWPIIVSAMALTVTAASANSRLDTVKDRVDYLYANGPPSMAVTLAKIQERQDEMVKTQEDMAKTLDDMNRHLYDLSDGRVHRAYNH